LRLRQRDVNAALTAWTQPFFTANLVQPAWASAVPANPMYRRDELPKLFADCEPAGGSGGAHDDQKTTAMEAVESAGAPTWSP
jgi:hypothetical protein